MSGIGIDCPACASDTLLKEVHLPFFRHMDFQVIADSLTFRKCPICGLFSQSDLFEQERTIFESSVYRESNQTRQSADWWNVEQNNTRSARQATYLSKNLPATVERVLDVGCFDGALLFFLSQHRSYGRLVGFDICDVEKDSRIIKAVDYFSRDQNEVFQEEYDLIVFSHSIGYVDNLETQLACVKQALAPDGIVIIQLPDVSRNPFYALMGDQALSFSEGSLIKALEVHGLSAERDPASPFPREMTIIARHRGSVRSAIKTVDCDMEDAFERVEIVKKCLEGHKGRGRLGVMGTTINAAFVDHMLIDTIEFFTDENIDIAAGLFRGKSVVHPNELRADDHVLMPYEEISKNLCRTFEAKYEGTYIPIMSRNPL